MSETDEDQKALKQELEFYRQQCNHLGAQMLRLQEEQSLTQRDARRAHTVATLVSRAYKAGEFLHDRNEIAVRFLEILLATTLYDRAVLFRFEPASNRFHLWHALGFPAGQPGQLLVLRALPERLCANSRTLPEAPIPELRAYLGLPYLLWAFEPRAEFALLLGNGSEVHTQKPFESKDVEVAATALEVLIHLERRAQMEENMHKLSLAVEQSPASVLITDAAGRIEYANPTFARMTGYRWDEVVGHGIASLQARYPATEQHNALAVAIARGEEWKGQLPSKTKQGKLYWEFTTLTPIRNPVQEITHYLLVSEDISVRKEYEERLTYQANYDALTDLPNRMLAFDRLAQALANGRRAGSKVVLIMVDLDQFKLANDTLGHLAGDELLIESAQRLRTCVRESDTVARLGGDEFLVVLPNIEDERHAERIAEKIHRAFSQPFGSQDKELFLTASIGITVFPDDGDEPNALLRNADSAMFEAKGFGRNSYRFFTPRMNVLAAERVFFESRLRHAVERKELMLHYQPIIEPETGRIHSVEALLRWFNPEVGLVPPDRFIPLAEETGLIVEIGAWVLHAACKELRRWRDAGAAPIQVAVNVSGRQFRDGGLFDTVRSALTEAGLPANALKLEITESSLVGGDVQEIARLLGELREEGMGLAIDDFGTGYSSLSYLKRYPLDTLKIDKSFVRDVNTDADDANLVVAMIAMAHGLGLQVVAEGVETEEQLAFLRRYDCDFVQGYLYSKPLPGSDLFNFLQQYQARPARAAG
ncbi:MAG: EAL domain-containing protein [Gammaproteobacteria bacterium]|nr:EAL domain-containing protein [Gammaproteobacteria bacterium]